MNSTGYRQVLGCLVAVILGLLSASAARAGHDHDHVFTTIDKYLGYDADSEITKVQVSTAKATYILSLHGSLRGLADEVGGKARITLSANGTWTHFAIDGRKAAVRIHTKKQI